MNIFPIQMAPSTKNRVQKAPRRRRASADSTTTMTDDGDEAHPIRETTAICRSSSFAALGVAKSFIDTCNGGSARPFIKNRSCPRHCACAMLSV
jgi:hypothetical protein